jgi:hypothetical protein
MESHGAGSLTQRSQVEEEQPTNSEKKQPKRQEKKESVEVKERGCLTNDADYSSSFLSLFIRVL